jgi:acetoin utilization deacetylase AcuC-like enzyme
VTTTALVYDERCLAHDNGSTIVDARAREWLDAPHPESAARIARSLAVLQASGVADRLEPVAARAATDDDLALVHSREHVGRIRAACSSDAPIVVGPQARAGGGSWEPALLSAGGTLAAVDHVLAGRSRNAYVLCRPPGHHASRDTAMGFCLFNNVAIAARHAQREHGLERIAIVDWDVHHGNGTHDTFYEDGSVLFVSLHQDALYPEDAGRAQDTGGGDGVGATVNVPLPAGTGDRGYLLAFERIVVPALRAFGPELVLVSAGQDPAASDPLGRMSVTTEGFRAMTGAVEDAADDLCDGRLVAVQEGGYSADHLPYCVLAIVERLAELSPALPGDPLEIDVPSSLRDWEADAVDEIAAAVGRGGVAIGAA